MTAPALAEARTLLLRDAPAYGALMERAIAARQVWLDHWPDGAPHVLGLLAQDLQEAVHARADRLWPLCAEHEDHPLFIEPDLGPDPFWVCHRTGLPVAAVGTLRG